MNRELILECVYEVAALARTRVNIRMTSKHLCHTLPYIGVLQSGSDIRLASLIFISWKRMRKMRVSSWVRKRVRNDETPILNGIFVSV